MEVARPGERLSDDPRADGNSVAADELSVGLVFKQEMGERRNHQRIDEP